MATIATEVFTTEQLQKQILTHEGIFVTFDLGRKAFFDKDYARVWPHPIGRPVLQQELTQRLQTMLQRHLIGPALGQASFTYHVKEQKS